MYVLVDAPFFARSTTWIGPVGTLVPDGSAGVVGPLVPDGPEGPVVRSRAPVMNWAVSGAPKCAAHPHIGYAGARYGAAVESPATTTRGSAAWGITGSVPVVHRRCLSWLR